VRDDALQVLNQQLVEAESEEQAVTIAMMEP